MLCEWLHMHPPMSEREAVAHIVGEACKIVDDNLAAFGLCRDQVSLKETEQLMQRTAGSSGGTGKRRRSPQVSARKGKRRKVHRFEASHVHGAYCRCRLPERMASAAMSSARQRVIAGMCRTYSVVRRQQMRAARTPTRLHRQQKKCSSTLRDSRRRRRPPNLCASHRC